MILDPSNEDAVKKAYKQLQALMDNAYELITDKKQEAVQFYNEQTHKFLMKHAWELLIPQPKDEWPEVLVELDYDRGFTWPQMTTYSYAMNALTPPNIGWASVHFGYAVIDNKLVRTTFLAHNKLVDYQVTPQGIVFDPLALQNNVQPDYYIGCPVTSKTYLELVLRTRQNPFEAYVEKEGYKMETR